MKMPVLEDVLASIAILLGPDDGENPHVRLDLIGKHNISSGTSNQAITQAVVVDPLKEHGFKITDIDRFATELHNPEITEPQGSGNTPRTNYRMLGGMAVKESEIQASELDRFVEDHGMLGFSPTQGHIASAVPFLGHAREMIMSGDIKRAMFYAKGSLFLGPHDPALRRHILHDGTQRRPVTCIQCRIRPLRRYFEIGWNVY